MRDVCVHEVKEEKICIEESWKKFLINEFKKTYMLDLKNFLVKEKKKKKIIYPRGENIFKAFELTHYEDVKVVILGQDPYHGPSQAHGLCFSVLPGIKPPPSLINIYKELQSDVGFTPVSHGYLANWAKQGILLLNSVLTVEHSKAGSHQGKGWEHFTDKVMKVLNERDDPVIFVLWGSYAKRKGEFIDASKHIVLQAAHPSPFSVYRGFFGCKHFSKINYHLKKLNKDPIDWQLPAVVEDF